MESLQERPVRPSELDQQPDQPPDQRSDQQPDQESMRARAGRWWTDPARRVVSSRFEARETAYFAHAAVDVLLRHVHGPVRAVLDVGCGPGRALAVAAARVPGARLIGVDPDPAALAEARCLLAGVADTLLLRGRAEDLTGGSAPAVPAPVDAALVLLNLALWDERLSPLRAIVDLLGPGGVLLVLDLVAPTDAATRATWSGFGSDPDEQAYLTDQMAAWPTAQEHRALATELARHPRAAEVRLALTGLYDVGAGAPQWAGPPFAEEPPALPGVPRAALLLVRAASPVARS